MVWQSRSSSRLLKCWAFKYENSDELECFTCGQAFSKSQGTRYYLKQLIKTKLLQCKSYVSLWFMLSDIDSDQKPYFTHHLNITYNRDESCILYIAGNIDTSRSYYQIKGKKWEYNWTGQYLIYLYTGCNRISYTTLKIYCDQTNSNITTHFLTEHFLTLQVFFTSVQYCCPWLCSRHPDDSLIWPTTCPRKWHVPELWR
jgi:hypothetical protein